MSTLHSHKPESGAALNGVPWASCLLHSSLGPGLLSAQPALGGVY